MRRFLFHIIFCPLSLFCQEIIIHVPEVDLIENRLELHQIGAEELLLDSTLAMFSNSLSDLLRKNGQIFVKEYGALSSSFLRGTSAAHTQLLWNGIPLNSLSAYLDSLSFVRSSFASKSFTKNY